MNHMATDQSAQTTMDVYNGPPVKQMRYSSLPQTVGTSSSTETSSQRSRPPYQRPSRRSARLAEQSRVSSSRRAGLSLPTSPPQRRSIYPDEVIDLITPPHTHSIQPFPSASQSPTTQGLAAQATSPPGLLVDTNVRSTLLGPVTTTDMSPTSNQSAFTPYMYSRLIRQPSLSSNTHSESSSSEHLPSSLSPPVHSSPILQPSIPPHHQQRESVIRSNYRPRHRPAHRALLPTSSMEMLSRVGHEDQAYPVVPRLTISSAQTVPTMNTQTPWINMGSSLDIVDFPLPSLEEGNDYNSSMLRVPTLSQPPPVISSSPHPNPNVIPQLMPPRFGLREFPSITSAFTPVSPHIAEPSTTITRPVPTALREIDVFPSNDELLPNHSIYSGSSIEGSRHPQPTIDEPPPLIVRPPPPPYRPRQRISSTHGSSTGSSSRSGPVLERPSRESSSRSAGSSRSDIEFIVVDDSSDSDDNDDVIIINGSDSPLQPPRAQHSSSTQTQVDLDEAYARQLQAQLNGEHNMFVSWPPQRTPELAHRNHGEVPVVPAGPSIPRPHTRRDERDGPGLIRDNFDALASRVNSWTRQDASRMLQLASSYRPRGRASGRSRRQQLMQGMSRMPANILVQAIIGDNPAVRLTYEDLLEIADNLGPARPQGLSRNTLDRLPVRAYKMSAQAEDSNCVVCMCSYEDKDKVRSLPCSHDFHQECIDQWFKDHKTCPICRVEIKAE